MNTTTQQQSISRVGRGSNKSHYHYCITDRKTNEKTYYKTLRNIKEDLGISPSNVYLMCKSPETERRKYNDILIEKCHEHYLFVEYGIEPENILT